MAVNFWSDDDVSVDVPLTPGRGIDLVDYSSSPAGYRSATPDQESFQHLQRDDNCATPDQENFQHLQRDDNCAGTAVHYTIEDTNFTNEWSEQYIQNEQQTSFIPGDDNNCAGTAVHYTIKDTNFTNEWSEQYIQNEQQTSFSPGDDNNCAVTAVHYTLKDTNFTNESSEQYIQNEQQTSLSPGDDNYAGPTANHTSKNTDPIEESNEQYLQSEQSLFCRGADSNFSGTEHVGGWNRCTPDGGVQTPFFHAKQDNNFSGTREGKHFDGRMAPRGERSLPYRDSVRTSGSGPRSDRGMLAKRATGFGGSGPRSDRDMLAKRATGFGGSGPRSDRDMLAKRATGFGGDPLGREVPPGFEKPLRPIAKYSVYVDGLPHDITEREVAHIFRPFDGYRGLRLFTKDNDRPQGVESVKLCFVDFTDIACARKAMDLLRGYKVDLKDPDAPGLRLKFARDNRRKVATRPGPYTGPRSRDRERSWG